MQFKKRGTAPRPLFRRAWPSAALLIAFVVSCARQPAPAEGKVDRVPTAAAPRADLRFGLVGEVTDVNVWALFDEPGARYANLAVRWEYWPRILAFDPTALELAPLVAQRVPGAVTAEDGRYIGTVELRPGLSWTDGTPLTSADVAFTVNTALEFQLGADWLGYYRPEDLEGAAAVAPQTVEFRFRRAPDAAAWQFGALLGPIVQRAYWHQAVEQAAALLPDADLRQSLDAAAARQALLLQQVDELNVQLLAAQRAGGQDRAVEAAVRRTQGDLDAATNLLAELTDQHDAAMRAARGALHGLPHEGEPTLGTWIPTAPQAGVWTNIVNPSYPYARPAFGRVIYREYADEATAVTALQVGDVDAVLTADGLSTAAWGSLQGDDVVEIRAAPSARLRFMVVNLGRPHLADSTLRRAIACLLASPEVVDVLAARGTSPARWSVPLSAWADASTYVACGKVDATAAPESAVERLRAAGYAWRREPSAEASGAGLLGPDGTEIPVLTLLAAQADPVKVEFALAAERKFEWAGLRVDVVTASDDAVNYALFSSGEYDLAVAGWRVPTYPAHLCSWLGEQGPFDYESEQLYAACDALSQETDLQRAAARLRTIAEVLDENLPFIPVYSESTVDAYRGITYGTVDLFNGLSGNFGLPSAAVPTP